jgi:short chain dehydrogenase
MCAKMSRIGWWNLVWAIQMHPPRCHKAHTCGCPKAVLAGRLATLPSSPVRAGMRRILRRVVDLKSLDGILELSWHANHLHRVGAASSRTSIAVAWPRCLRWCAVTAPRRLDGSGVCEVKPYSLSDKVVLITGAGRGLGAATAALAQRGARVALADIDLSSAQRVAATLPIDRGLALECDVTQMDSLNEAVRRTHHEFGRIDVAIANAGVLGRGLGVELARHGASAMTAYFSLIETDMIRQGVDADPHVLALLAAMPNSSSSGSSRRPLPLRSPTGWNGGPQRH